MSENKTKPTLVNIDDFLGTVSEKRRQESIVLIGIMAAISKEVPVMWGPSIIGFGVSHYEHETGRNGDIPRLSFSPRKASITIYFAEGFGPYGEKLKQLGKYKNSISCLYINNLNDINIEVLSEMIKESYNKNQLNKVEIKTVQDYVDNVPMAARAKFDELRSIVAGLLPNAKEVYSYGIIGYKIDDKRARVFVSGWKDHVAMYPVPKDEDLVLQLKPYIKGKGTLSFGLDNNLPRELIEAAVRNLVS